MKVIIPVIFLVLSLTPGWAGPLTSPRIGLRTQPVVAQAESPKRIELKPGAAAITLEGQVRKTKDVSYIFSARAGQKFMGRLIRKEGNIGFEVTGPDGAGLPEEEFDFNTNLQGTLPTTGDYKITVATFEERDSKYTLSVRVSQ